MPMAFRAAWIATVPVFTHWAYFAVCNSANFLPKATEYLPGKGWPPHLELASTSSRAARSSFRANGHSVKGVLRKGSPPAMASLVIGARLIDNDEAIASSLKQYDSYSARLTPAHAKN